MLISKSDDEKQRILKNKLDSILESLDVKDFGAACEALDHLSSEEKRHPCTVKIRIKMALMQDQIALAATLLDSVSMDGYDAEWHFLAARCHARMNSLSRAIDHLNHAVDRDGKYMQISRSIPEFGALVAG